MKESWKNEHEKRKIINKLQWCFKKILKIFMVLVLALMFWQMIYHPAIKQQSENYWAYLAYRLGNSTNGVLTNGSPNLNTTSTVATQATTTTSPATTTTVTTTSTVTTTPTVGITTTLAATTTSTSTSTVPTTTTAVALEKCPEKRPGLVGKIPVIKSPIPEIEKLEKRFTWVKLGGTYSPPECRPKDKVAIVVPYRDRPGQFPIFLQHMHPFLKKQQIEYRIFQVEQYGNDTFNKAILENIGFKEALKVLDFDCIIFNDVDHLPENDEISYACQKTPTHISACVEQFGYKTEIGPTFGGVVTLTKKQFETVNGYSNAYWGWGGEDDDMYFRITYHNLGFARHPADKYRFSSLTHKLWTRNPSRYKVLGERGKRFQNDGLSNLNYTVVKFHENKLYTWVLVEFPVPDEYKYKNANKTA